MDMDIFWLGLKQNIPLRTSLAVYPNILGFFVLVDQIVRDLKILFE